MRLLGGAWPASAAGRLTCVWSLRLAAQGAGRLTVQTWSNLLWAAQAEAGWRCANTPRYIGSNMTYVCTSICTVCSGPGRKQALKQGCAARQRSRPYRACASPASPDVSSLVHARHVHVQVHGLVWSGPVWPGLVNCRKKSCSAPTVNEHQSPSFSSHARLMLRVTCVTDLHPPNPAVDKRIHTAACASPRLQTCT